jgi:hypothetical protein
MVLFHESMNNFHDLMGKGELFSDLKGVWPCISAYTVYLLSNVS